LAIRVLSRRSGAGSRACTTAVCCSLACWLAAREATSNAKLNLGVARVGFLLLSWIAAVVVAVVVVVAMDAAGRPAVVIDNGTGYFPSFCMLFCLCVSLCLCVILFLFSFLFFPTYLLKVVKISGSLDFFSF
jgi:hypothetical protein